MCLIGIMVGEEQLVEYDLMVTNTRDDPYIRFASHVTYELNVGRGFTMAKKELGASVLSTLPLKNYYHYSVETSTIQGLCKFFGSTIFTACGRVLDFSYVDTLTFFYASFDLSKASDLFVKHQKVEEMRVRLVKAIELALKENPKIIN
jgi:hypothetical protein